MRDAVGAGNRDEFRVGVDREPRLDLRRVGADLAGIDRGAHGRYFHQAKCGGRRDEAGEQVLPLEIDDLRLTGGGLILGRADGFDRVVGDEYKTGRVCWP